MDTRAGGCGCGQIRYEFGGEPINSAFCYCHTCQQHTGSDKWFGLWVPKDQFRFTRGEPQTYTRKGDSGQDMHHRFCRNCGVTLCAEVTVAGFYTVAASTLDVGDYGPRMVIYASHAPGWAVFPPGIPKYDLLPPGLGD